MTIIGLPRLGIYTSIIKEFFEKCGFPVLTPGKVTREIIRLGAMNSADMMCFPYKVILGQHIWALENGATDLIMWNNCGVCRMKHYYELEMATLSELGYSFNMHVLTSKNLGHVLRRLGHLSFFESIRRLKEVFSRFKAIDVATYSSKSRGLKIGLIGEVYTMWEKDINFDIVLRLLRGGVDVDMSITLTDFVGRKAIKGKQEEKEARQLHCQELGGHGFESLCNLIWYAKNGFDGVIHLMPLSCMPESTVEILLDQVAARYGLPLYRFPIDESNFEQGFLTRLETFISMLRRRKKCEVSV